MGGHLHGVLLGVGEARHALSADERLAVLGLGVGQDHGTMAYSGDGLVLDVEFLDEGDGVLVGDEVEHGAVAAGVEDGVELGGAANELGQGLGVLPDGLVVLEEVLAGWVLLEHLNGKRVDGRDAALGGGDYDFGVGGEDIVGVGELRLWMRGQKRPRSH